jgi:hypothetical protein
MNRVPRGVHYKNIVVHANIKDIGGRKLVEDVFVDHLLSLGLNATPSYQLFTPGNKITLDEKKKAIRDLGFDAVLTIQILKATQTQDTVNFPTPVPDNPPVNRPLEQAANDLSHSDVQTVDERKNLYNQPVDGKTPIPPVEDHDKGWDHRRPIVSPPEPDPVMDLDELSVTYTKTHFKIKTNLFESSDFVAVWIAQTSTHEEVVSPAEFSMEKFMDTYANKIVTELLDEEVVADLAK